MRKIKQDPVQGMFIFHLGKAGTEYYNKFKPRYFIDTDMHAKKIKQGNFDIFC